MIISRTPFRISFFGGGTDYPVWFNENKGAVLATTIDKYCYISCRYLPPFFDHKYRIVYSKMENVRELREIQHPLVREGLRFTNINSGVELHHDADLPARSGLGSSSSFAVGLLHTLYALKGQMADKKMLADQAIHLEQNVLKENVGCQDQYMAAFGGFNIIHFNGLDDIKVEHLILKPERIKELEDHLMLIFTGFTRFASDIASEQIKIIPKKNNELQGMLQMVEEGASILTGNKDIANFGKLLHNAWLYKKSLTHKISNERIDEIYKTGLEAGALGGKILGAGGGGFMLLFVRPEKQKKVREALTHLLFVSFSFENSGSTIIVYQPDKTKGT
jgi:D-glycero-alpha-D-manno-heptose-7-phosphate kinase